MMVVLGKAFFQLDLEQEDGVFAEGPEDKDYTGDDPGLDGRQALGLGRVRLDRVEDVDQHEEDCHQERHSTCRKSDGVIENLLLSFQWCLNKDKKLNPKEENFS